MKGTYSRAIIFMERTKEEWNVIISDTSWALQSMLAKYKGDYSECYYLDEKAIIESGNGTKNQPYIISKPSNEKIELIEVPNTIENSNKIENPNTGTGLYVVISIIILVFSSCIYLIIKQKKSLF